jgi:hypothetical protein
VALNWLTAIRGLTQFAVKVGLLQDDPTVGIERAKLPNTEGFHSWSEEEIARYEAKHPVGSRARMAMALVLYTALRRGDIVTLGPNMSGTEPLLCARGRLPAQLAPRCTSLFIQRWPKSGEDSDKAPDISHHRGWHAIPPAEPQLEISHVVR